MPTWYTQGMAFLTRFYYLLLSIFFLFAFVSAVLVTYTQHECRLLIGQLQDIQFKKEALHGEWSQLVLEQGAWANHGRIEKIARERLNMHLPTDKERVLILGSEKNKAG
jgi:cell division protein FtsL